MFSKIFLSKEKLFNNIAHMEKITPGKICAMIKANVYGHGTKEILPLLSEKIDYFGVSSEEEAIEARAYTDKTIIVFGLCEDYKKCMENDISFAVFSLLHIKKIVKIAQKYNLKFDFDVTPEHYMLSEDTTQNAENITQEESQEQPDETPNLPESEE